MKILVICRGPIAEESLQIISNLSLPLPHIIISRREWLDNLETCASWLWNWSRFEKLHLVDEYSDIEAIVRIVKSENIDAVYPGYGFLAENADFAKRCEKEQIIFIGPNSKTLELMGLKDQARNICKSIGVPVTPGTDSLEYAILERETTEGNSIVDALKRRIQKWDLEVTATEWKDALTEATELAQQKNISIFSDEEFIQTAEKEAAKLWQEHGQMPVRIKASAGGGGKGQRIFNNKEEIPKAMREVWNEIGASKVGSNKSVILEANIEKPRHMEVQILGDGENVVHFGIRDCSFQTMFYQKLIEIGVHENQVSEIYADDPEQLEAEKNLIRGLQEAAVKITQHIGYKNAGTVEFLVDDKRNFYFMEVNARIQVEHGVSEEISRLKGEKVSLVAEQIRIAKGEKLGYTQNDITFSGYALETRISLLDSLRLQPSPGATIRKFNFPKDNNIRIEDSGLEEILKKRDICPPSQYDANITLNIYTGDSFAEMLSTAIDNLLEANIAGEDLQTTIPFHLSVLEWLRNQKAKTKITTQFVEIHLCLLQLYKNKVEILKKDIDTTALKYKRNPLPCLSLIKEIVNFLSCDPSLAVTFFITPKEFQSPAEFLWKLALYLKIDIWSEDHEYLNELHFFYGNLQIIANDLKANINLKELTSETMPSNWKSVVEAIAKVEKQEEKTVWQALTNKYKNTFCVEMIEHIEKTCSVLEELPHRKLTSLDDGTVQIPEEIKSKEVRAKILTFSKTTKQDDNTITSPILGIFFRSPKPDMPPFVEVGQHVKIGQTLFLTGAMKVYTEVQSPKDGVIKEILVEDGKLLKQGQLVMILE